MIPNDKETKALLLLESFAGDILEELTDNLGKDISNNRNFWNEMHKKYRPVIEEMENSATG